MSLTPEQVTAYCINRVDSGFIISILSSYNRNKIDEIIDYLVLNEAAIIAEYSSAEYFRLLDTVRVARFGRLP